VTLLYSFLAIQAINTKHTTHPIITLNKDATRQIRTQANQGVTRQQLHFRDI